jgi:hypothetical protein
VYEERGKIDGEVRKTWHDAYNRSGEYEDLYYRIALRGVDEPLDAAFERNARAVFGPMRGVIEEDETS